MEQPDRLAEALQARDRGAAQEAEALLLAFLTDHPDHGAAHHVLGQLLAERGAREEALVHQQRSCRLHPQLGWNWFAAAELLDQLERWEDALRCLQRAALELPAEGWIEAQGRQVRLRQQLGGEDLRHGLGPQAYRYWLQHLEPRLPGPAVAIQERWLLLPIGRELSLWPQEGWLVLLGAGVRLRSGALQALEAWLAAAPADADPQLLYTDEDRLDASGQRCNPWFKPGWCPESFWSTPWLQGCSIWRISWLRGRGLPLPPAAAAERCRWLLLALECQPRIVHVPLVLAHSLNAPGRPEESRIWARELQAHLQRQGEAITRVEPVELEAQAASFQPGFRLQWALPAGRRCELIIPTRDRADLLAACLRSVWRTAPKALELAITVVDNGSCELATQQLFAEWSQRLGPRWRVLCDPGPFNWSRLNNRVALASRAELLLFLNNDIEALEPGWLEAMARQALRPSIGCVGAVLTYPDGSLQHAGVVVGMHGGADHAYRQLPPDHAVHRGRSRYLSGWGAVTGACLMVRRKLFQQLGGFDERLPVEFNDIEFCLRLGALGYRHVVVPEATLLHRESQSRPAEASATAGPALERLRCRWSARLSATAPWWPQACSQYHGDGRPRSGLDPFFTLLSPLRDATIVWPSHRAATDATDLWML
jgi:GT2 family glycosyltransferase